MLYRNYFLKLVFLFIGFSLNVSAKNKFEKNNNLSLIDSSRFSIKRGINISHWLSQTDKNQKERKQYFSEVDMQLIASLGYDHIRLPIDEKNMWSIKNEKDSLAFQSLHNAIHWAKKYNLKVIVDLHIVRAHYFNNKHNTLWDDISEQQKFVTLWRQLSSELKKYPTSLVAYEILNEPVATNHEEWNQLLNVTLKEIRIKEPKRMVIIGSNKWQSVDTFKYLKIPKNDSNIMLSFHFYSPHVFTHYKAPWSKKVRFYTGPVKYPGITIHQKDLIGYTKKQIENLMEDDLSYSKKVFLKRIKEPIKIAKKYNLQLYCGEFGCLPTTPNKDRMEWYKDLTNVLEENNIAWANWDYQGRFGIKNSKTGNLNTALIQVLFKSL